MAEILDGKTLAKKIRKELKLEVEELKQKGIIPKLAVIMVGDNSASQVYVRNKSRACEKVGIEFEEFLFDKDTLEEELINTIDNLNKDEIDCYYSGHCEAGTSAQPQAEAVKQRHRPQADGLWRVCAEVRCE